MFKKNHKNVTPKNTFSSLPKADDAYSQSKKIQESKKKEIPVLSKEEIIAKIEREINQGSISTVFLDKTISDEDKKALEDLGYEVKLSISESDSSIDVFIYWNR